MDWKKTDLANFIKNGNYIVGDGSIPTNLTSEKKKAEEEAKLLNR